MLHVSRLGGALATAALALVTTACSGGDDSGTPAAGGSATSRAAAPSATAEPSPTAASDAPGAAGLTQADAEAAAAKINLTSQDLPGFVQSPPPPRDPAGERAYAEFVRCLGGEEPVYDLPSDTFATAGGSGFTSSVAVFADEDVLRADLAALASEAALDCTGTYVQTLQGATGEVAVERITPEAPDTEGAFGFRVTTTGADGSTMRVATLGVGAGRTEVSLFSFGDVPQEQQAALFDTLVERARAHAP